MQLETADADLLGSHFENLCFPLLLPFITLHPDAAVPTYNERICEQSLRALDRLLTKSDGFWTSSGAQGRWLELMQEARSLCCTRHRPASAAAVGRVSGADG